MTANTKLSRAGMRIDEAPTPSASGLNDRLYVKSDMRQRNKDFARGYFCAVAALLREEGAVTTQIRDLFNCGGDAEKLADDCDKELFIEYGLLPYNAELRGERSDSP